jgi:DNA-binding CsgD family transcriptional regulator
MNFGEFTKQKIDDQPADLLSKQALYFKSTIIRFPNEALYIYSFAENKLIYTDGWDEVLGYNNQTITLNNIIDATTPEFANFSKELNDKAILFILSKKDRLEDYSYAFEVKKMHQNGTQVPMQVRVGVFTAKEGKIETVIGRFQVNESLIFGKIMNFATYGPHKNNFEEELNKSLFTQLVISEREKEALKLASKGLSIKQMSEALFITKSAVEKRIFPLYKRFNVNNLPHLISFAYENHILP